MPKYRVLMENVMSTVIEVEAENEEAAKEAVFESDQMPSRICAQCTGWGQSWSIDEGEWDISEEEDAVQLVEDA